MLHVMPIRDTLIVDHICKEATEAGVPSGRVEVIQHFMVSIMNGLTVTEGTIGMLLLFV
jgi:hypothetical protein